MCLWLPCHAQQLPPLLGKGRHRNWHGQLLRDLAFSWKGQPAQLGHRTAIFDPGPIHDTKDLRKGSCGRFRRR